MPRPDGRLEPGQPLRGAISARAWNRMMDASDIVHGDQFSQSATGPQSGKVPYTWVYCKPSVTVPRWGVLAITGVEITPTSTESDTATKTFQDSPVVTGGTPSATTTAWGVAVEPIASGSIGRLAVGGVVQCKVSITNSSDKFVRCGTSTTQLTSDVRGEGLILWQGNGWALVRLGSLTTVEQDVITGVTLGTGGLVFTKETLYVIGKKSPSPSSVTISTTACT